MEQNFNRYPKETIDIVIKPVHSADAALMAALHGAAFGQPWDDSWSAKAMAELMASPGTYGFIALSDRIDNVMHCRESKKGVVFAMVSSEGAWKAEPVGMILCRMAAQEAEILTLGVIPTMRTRAIGAALVRASIEKARKHAVIEIFLEVAEDNTPARALYQSAGFKKRGKRPKYYSRPHGPCDAIVMCRTLPILEGQHS